MQGGERLGHIADRQSKYLSDGNVGVRPLRFVSLWEKLMACPQSGHYVPMLGPFDGRGRKSDGQRILSLSFSLLPSPRLLNLIEISFVAVFVLQLLVAASATSTLIMSFLTFKLRCFSRRWPQLYVREYNKPISLAPRLYLSSSSRLSWSLRLLGLAKIAPRKT